VSDAVDLGPESLLGIPDGEDAQTLRDRLELALRYIANWYKATKGSDNQDIWWARIDQVRAKVEAAFRAADPGKVFLGNSDVALYNEAALAFPGLWRELTLSRDTLPDPGLIDILASVADTLIETPGFLVSKVTNSLAKGVGAGVASIWANLWPVLVLAGVAGLVYVFRAPLAAAAGKLVPR
jgi:hypothetical protein